LAVLAVAIHRGLPPLTIIGVHILSNLMSHAFEPASRGWIADHTTVAQRHRAYGVLRVASYVGFVAGPTLGGLIADRSYALVFAAAAIVCALCAVAATLALPGDSGGEHVESVRVSWVDAAGIDRSFLILCFYNALLSVVMAQLVVPMSLYATKYLGMPDSRVGLLLSLNAAFIVVCQIPTVHLFSGIRLTVAAGIGALCYAVGFGWMGFAGGMVGLALAVIIISVGEVLVPAAVQTLAANMSPEDSRGRYIGILGLSRQVGSAIGPTVGSAGLEWAMSNGLPGHWPGIAGLAVVSAIGFLMLGSRLLPDEEGLLEEGIPEKIGV